MLAIFTWKDNLDLIACWEQLIWTGFIVVSSSSPELSSSESALLQGGHTLLASASFQVSWNS